DFLAFCSDLTGIVKVIPPGSVITQPLCSSIVSSTPSILKLKPYSGLIPICATCSPIGNSRDIETPLTEVEVDFDGVGAFAVLAFAIGTTLSLCCATGVLSWAEILSSPSSSTGADTSSALAT